MGDESWVSKAIQRVKESRAKKLNQLKQQLLKGTPDTG
jgi:hypothetical protein